MSEKKTGKVVPTREKVEGEKGRKKKSVEKVENVECVRKMFVGLESRMKDANLDLFFMHKLRIARLEGTAGKNGYCGICKTNFGLVESCGMGDCVKIFHKKCLAEFCEESPDRCPGHFCFECGKQEGVLNSEVVKSCKFCPHSVCEKHAWSGSTEEPFQCAICLELDEKIRQARPPEDE